jgi:hypothetical protein
MKRLIILFLIASVLVSSCASFSKIDLPANAEPITEDNFDDLSGTFSIYPTYGLNNNASLYPIETEFGSSIPLLFHQGNLLVDSVSIEMESLKKMKLVYHHHAEVVWTVEVFGKTKRSGFFYPDSFRDCEGIPLLFGGCTTDRIRLIGTTDGSLIIQKTHYQFGAVLIIFGADFGYDKTFLFVPLSRTVES